MNTGDKDEKDRAKIWAHRGANEYAPENTLEAFEWAVKLGADGIELDVHESRDQEIVVIHDRKLDRTSSASGWVKDYTLKELKQFDYSRGTRFSGEKRYAIPTLREVFELIRPTGLTMNIELKTNVFPYLGIEQRLLEMAEEYGMRERVCYSSFNHLSIEKIHLLEPSAKVGLLYADAKTWMPSFAGKAGIDALHPAFFNLFAPHFLEDCRKNALAINIWTIDTRDKVLASLQAGVHAIITNYPDKAMRTARAWEEGTLTADDMDISTLIYDDLVEREESLRKRVSLARLDDQMRREIYEKLRDQYRARKN